MERKKELRADYKEAPETGGVYRVTCAGNGRTWIKSGRNLQGKINRFNFSVSTGMCPERDMKPEWDAYGPGSFSVAVVEELTRGETQTEREFSDDLDTLLRMHLEKQPEG